MGEALLGLELTPCCSWEVEVSSPRLTHYRGANVNRTFAIGLYFSGNLNRTDIELIKWVGYPFLSVIIQNTAL